MTSLRCPETWAPLPAPFYERAGITLYNGDCRSILPTLEAEAFDMVLTDPPYLVSYSGRWDAGHEIIHGDDDPSWVYPVYSEVWRLLRPDSLCLTFYGWPEAETFLRAWREVGLRPVSLVVLVKDKWGLGHFTRAQHEQLYLLAKGHPTKPTSAPSDVLEWQQPKPQLHPNQKPLGAISKLINTYTSPGSLILDPFCGSGTTLVAARNLGRRAIGIEIEKRYCEIAALRLSQEIFHFTDEFTPAEQLALISQGRMARYEESEDTIDDRRRLS